MFNLIGGVIAAYFKIKLIMLYLAIWYSGLVGGQLKPSTNKKKIIKRAKKTASFYNFHDETTHWRVICKDDNKTIAAGGVTAAGRNFRTL